MHNSITCISFALFISVCSSSEWSVKKAPEEGEVGFDVDGQGSFLARDEIWS